MSAKIENRILPLRTAEQQFEIAGCETILTRINPHTKLAHVDGKGGPACLPEEEWENYKALCEKWKATPVDLQGSGISMLVVESEEAAKQICQQRIAPDDLRRIYRSLRIALQEARACVTSAQHTLSVEDYGEALQAAFKKLSLSIGCVQGLENWRLGDPETGRCPWCGLGLLMSEDRGAHCDACGYGYGDPDEDFLEAVNSWHEGDFEECASDLLKGVPVEGGLVTKNVLKNMIGQAFLEGAVAQITRPYGGHDGRLTPAATKEGGPDAA